MILTQVVTVQCDPGGTVGNVYRLGWKEECIDDADDTCEVKTITAQRRPPGYIHNNRILRSLRVGPRREVIERSV